MRDPVEIVRGLSAQSLGKFPGGAFSLLAEDIVFLSWDGHVFVGHEGIAVWFNEMVRTWENIEFREISCEHVGGGWVLTNGDILFRDRDGEEHVQPGWWLAQVQNGKITATLYYRTPQEAKNALRIDESSQDVY